MNREIISARARNVARVARQLNNEPDTPAWVDMRKALAELHEAIDGPVDAPAKDTRQHLRQLCDAVSGLSDVWQHYSAQAAPDVKRLAAAFYSAQAHLAKAEKGN